MSKNSVLRAVVLVLFAASGCSALIYEIVWYQLLQLAIGSTAVSLAILLATFMGGLCLGSLALPRLINRLGALAAWPLRAYALLEAGIALFGLGELLLIPAVEGLYVSGIQHGMPGMLLRGLICALCLLPPTILMGASLPVIARWANTASAGAREGGGAPWWALLYGANTFGAVFGALLAGFYLLRLYDITVATLTAAAVNLAAALVSVLLAQKSGPQPEPHQVPQQAPQQITAPRDWSAHIAIALSGAAALGGEVVWTRLMGLMLGATTYAFSIILAVFLVGLALGSAAGSSLVRRRDTPLDPGTALGWCQILAALGAAWTAYMIADALPYWPINPLLTPHARFIFQIDLARVLCALLPPTLFWGASFPLAFAAARGGDPGRVVGGIYAANTFGAIFGALTVSLILVPWLGTQNTQRALLALPAAGALVMLARPAWRAPVMAGGIVLGMALIAFLAYSIDAVPGDLIAYGRRMPMNAGYSTILYTGEGRDTSIAVSRWKSDDSIQFHVAGKVEASTNAVDMKLQRILGHLPALAQAAPRSVLIVGFGAGVTAGSFTTYPTIARIVICEMEPLIPPASTKYFGPQNYRVAQDKRTHITFDDARHFVLTSPEKFDIITSDPIHPFVRGSAALYSKEYFEAEKAHLTPGGMVTQWVPLYESDMATVKSEIATFLAVFPDGLIFANTDGGNGYDLALVGMNKPGPIDVDAMQARLATDAYMPVRESLMDVGISSASGLLSTYIGNRDDLKPWLADAQINRDRNLRLQYLAGMALNISAEDAIYRKILSYRKLPTSAFSANPEHLAELFVAMRNESFRTSGGGGGD